MAKKKFDLSEEKLDQMDADEMRELLRDIAESGGTAEQVYGRPGGGGHSIAGGGVYNPGVRHTSSESEQEFVGNFASRFNNEEPVSTAERNRFVRILTRDHVVNSIARSGNSRLADLLRQHGHGQ